LRWTLYHTILVTLGPPNVVDHRSLSDSISLDVALFHKDYNSLVYSYPGHVEYAVIKYGMKIQVTLRSHPQFESSSLDKTPNVVSHDDICSNMLWSHSCRLPCHTYPLVKRETARTVNILNMLSVFCMNY